MENKKGSGIFLGVVSVATLIVAIIGATFAYFTATASSNGGISAQAYEFSASVTVERVDEQGAKGLIPMDDNDLSNALGATELCQDDNSYAVCHVYSVTVSNNSASAITLNGVAKTTTNNFVLEDTSYMYIAPVTSSSGAYSVTSGATATALPVDSEGTPVALSNFQSVTVPAATTTPASSEGEEATVVPGTSTFYFVTYISDKNVDQSAFMGKTYTGEVEFTVAGSNGKLVATFGTPVEQQH